MVRFGFFEAQTVAFIGFRKRVVVQKVNRTAGCSSGYAGYVIRGETLPKQFLPADIATATCDQMLQNAVIALQYQIGVSHGLVLQAIGFVVESASAGIVAKFLVVPAYEDALTF